jgi:hypothetical protein
MTYRYGRLLTKNSVQEFRLLASAIMRRLARVGCTRGLRNNLGAYLATEWQAGAGTRTAGQCGAWEPLNEPEAPAARYGNMRCAAQQASLP